MTTQMQTPKTASKVANPALAEQGRLKIEWAESRMPVLMALRGPATRRRSRSRAPAIAGCLHVTKETAVLVRTLRAAGAEVSWSGCNPLSTQDDVAAALAAEGTSIYAWHGMNDRGVLLVHRPTLDFEPTLTLDDGADLIFTVHIEAHRARADASSAAPRRRPPASTACAPWPTDGKLLYPVIAVNDAETKWDFDNVYGTGQSSLDGILRATIDADRRQELRRRRLRALRPRRAPCARRGMGANVIVTEIKPTAALKAALEGFAVMTMDEAAQDRRHLHHRHRHEGRHRRAATSTCHEGRRRRLQHRPLRLRDQPRGAGQARQEPARRSGRTTRSTCSRTAAASTCWPRAGS